MRYSSGLEGAGVNDMMIVSVNQTLALPIDVASPLVGEPVGTWGGAGGGQAPAAPACCACWLNQQFGRGRLTLASPDPDVHPLIDQDLSNVEADRVRMRDGVKRSLELLRSGSFDTAFERVAIDMTGRGLDALSDDRAIDAWLMETIGDTGHICGTCRMGAPDDPRSVVDPAGGCSASTTYGWRTPPCFPPCHGRTRTCRRSRLPSGCPTSSAMTCAAPPRRHARGWQCKRVNLLATRAPQAVRSDRGGGTRGRPARPGHVGARVARVAVDDETWAASRGLLGVTPASVASAN